MKIEMISITSYCIQHQVDASFIESLENGRLIEVIKVDDEKYLPFSVLPQLEKYIRWHYELEINTEGIETIHYLLHKIDLLKREVAELTSRLNVYERQ